VDGWREVGEVFPVEDRPPIVSRDLAAILEGESGEAAARVDEGAPAVVQVQVELRHGLGEVDGQAADAVDVGTDVEHHDRLPSAVM
jgi:hypothetical protein